MRAQYISLLVLASALSIQAAPLTLPPLPRDVTELKFNDFYVTPIGDRGLKFI